MIAFTQQLAMQNAAYGIRANCILPGLMDTPMAVDTRARAEQPQPRRGRRRARRQGAVARQDGHRLGCRQRGAVPRLGRGQFHHRRGLAGRRRRAGEDRMRSARRVRRTLSALPRLTLPVARQGGNCWPLEPARSTRHRGELGQLAAGSTPRASSGRRRWWSWIAWTTRAHMSRRWKSPRSIICVETIDRGARGTVSVLGDDRPRDEVRLRDQSSPRHVYSLMDLPSRKRICLLGRTISSCVPARSNHSRPL